MLGGRWFPLLSYPPGYRVQLHNRSVEGGAAVAPAGHSPEVWLGRDFVFKAMSSLSRRARNPGSVPRKQVAGEHADQVTQGSLCAHEKLRDGDIRWCQESGPA